MVDDLILINTFETSAKNKHLTKGKRIALSVVEQNNPFNKVSIKGKVIDRTTEGADEHLKRLAKKYLGIGKYYYRKPSHKRIIIKIQPEKIMGISIYPAFYFLAYSPCHFDLLINTIQVEINVNRYLILLTVDGVMVVVASRERTVDWCFFTSKQQAQSCRLGHWRNP